MNGVERWLPVIGYEGSYEVSDFGRVRSLDRINSRGHSLTGRVLSPCPNTSGHLQVPISAGCIQRLFQVHRLVLTAFVGPCPAGMEGCHWNGDPTDNRAANLRWDTQSANQLDSIRHGTHVQSSKTHCLQGHPFSGENLYIRPKSGGRSCNECQRQRRAKYRETHREEVREYMRLQRALRKAA